MIPATSVGHQLAPAVDGNGSIHKCFHKEKQALLDFKARLQDPLGQLLTWRPQDDCCKWSGVACNNQTGHVTELYLPSYLTYNFGEAFLPSFGLDGLRGEISPSLVNLTYLNLLDLSFNSFHGTIPSSIGSMTKLRYLDLSFNALNGTIPKSIGFMTELRYLFLSGNFLTGTIPSEFGNLTNLIELALGGPFVSFRVGNLDWLSTLSHLQYLDMDGVSLAKANHWVDVILSLRNMSYLSLEGCDLSEVMHPYSSFVNSSSSIEFLHLAGNNLNSSMYRWLFPLASKSLISLDLSYNMLDGIPRYFGNLCGLKVLTLSRNSGVGKFDDFLNNLFGCTSVSLLKLEASYNQFTGSLSDEIQRFASLQQLYLSNNHLNGIMSEKVWELANLTYLDVSSNSLGGVVMSENIGKSKQLHIDLSNNSFEVIPSKDHMLNLSYVEYLDLSDCKLGPLFPKWIHKHKNLTYLDIANTRISDTVPVQFWKTWPSRLSYLDLSSNNISGKIPDLSSNFNLYPIIDLSSNNFSGPVPDLPSTLVSLNLSKNKFNGGISFICQIVDGFLSFLDLSHNSFTGQLPDCLWHFKELQVLNLGHNNLSGRLPAAIGYAYRLEVLNLYSNNFSGELPLSLKNCTELKLLNLGANKFFGNVPVWVGQNLTGLYVLILRSNNFFGTIPLQVCHLVNLQILDLSMNNLNGTIPSCVNKLDAMVHGRFVPTQDSHATGKAYKERGGDTVVGSYIDDSMIKWQGNEREFTRDMGLITSIDLSSNKLTGQVPNELTDLHEVRALNLSRNALLGEIPRKIGEMKELLTLDLSRNNFSGRIPSSMSQLTLLSYLDVSYNKLSGRIPSSTQLQSFEPSSYAGNAGLCGPPLTKNCP
ncbi:receptor-like protein EIX2 [Cynara cardunculus var. scolymus]|uniref:receptor-like protein EIX2 n=1 Tax=Cynara cardunculus var. scolymus TaxID=59895 RepID=UPI000D62D1F3|nr:receptor-like protein EIX2 [Cynara cardunculus var. scolymus]